jgi:hypothetical protein
MTSLRRVMKLVKTLGAAGLAAAALGGAAALGSNLFEGPPRNAAEFAERVEAGSTHIDPNRKRAVVEKKRGRKHAQKRVAPAQLAAERRYTRTLESWCVQQERDVDALASGWYASDYLDRILALSRSWRARVAALRPPARLRGKAARYLGAWARLEGLTVRLVRSGAHGDTVASLELWDRWIHTAAVEADAAIAMGADRCAGSLFEGVTPSS